MGGQDDLLSGVAWECVSLAPGRVSDPTGLAALQPDWAPAVVPGTAAGAARLQGRTALPGYDYDATDWWFRCRFAAPDGGSDTHVLDIGGLATIADVWCNGEPVLHSENMFRSYRAGVRLKSDNELVIACRALGPALAVRRPRPRWRTPLATHQNLRWYRTSLLGRSPGWTMTPAAVGPWRPLTLCPAASVTVTGLRVITRCDGEDGVVTVTAGLEGADQIILTAGGVETAVHAVAGHIEAELRLPRVKRWWPHSHGEAVLYPVQLRCGDQVLTDRAVGFRTVAVDRTDGGFSVVVNAQPIFCRGACWFPPDPVNMATSDDDLRHTLDLARRAGCNMLRIPGGAVYEDEAFWSACDELGLLVWQDCMFGYLDPPHDDGFVAEVELELTEVFARLASHPALAVLCGGQEIAEQAAMAGLRRADWAFPLQDEVIPRLAGRLLPDVPYITSSPSGGDLPFQPGSGVTHYFGVGTYLRPLTDARLAGVRFMSEGLAYGTPPEPATVDEACGGPWAISHDPAWKQAVHHDTGKAFDLDDTRDYYVRQLFGVDPLHQRYVDPERALELGRAAVAEVMSSVLGEWRRPGSKCAGAIVIALRDLAPGAGWGLIDALGRPKASLYAAARAFRPTALVFTDEGLNGLDLHLLNDGPERAEGTLRVELFAHGELALENAECRMSVAGRSGTTVSVGSLFDGFRDVSYAYRFGPPPYDVVSATLTGADGSVIACAVHLPAGPARNLEPDVGLAARAYARPDSAGGPEWFVEVTTRRLAQFVAFDVPAWEAEDSWFHLAPGATRAVRLRPDGGTGTPRGRVRALNSEAVAPIRAGGPVTGDT